jgi:ribosomal protein S12 methylthiotransferase
LRTKSHKDKQIQVVTLGCSKNWVDSENLITQLIHSDFDVEHNPTDYGAPTVIINTCGFIERAKEESIQTILEFAKLKSRGHIEQLYVSGCLSQRYKDQLEVDIPEVDAYFGTLEMPALLRRLNANYRAELLGERQISTPGHYAFLKISEGCNRTCSFCAIPLMRGKHISVPEEQLLHQARQLAAQGVKELILIAQELTYYGLDLNRKRLLPSLLEKLANVEGIEWLRLHYAYPAGFPLELLDVMREHPKVCRYLDLPLQHISDHVLKAMHRGVSSGETKALIEKIRRAVPEIHIRTTFLVGFPGETSSDFKELCHFVEEQQFDRMGVFTYSHEDGTGAHSLEDSISQEVKDQRAQELMDLQESISLKNNQLKVGAVFKTLIDRKTRDHYYGRTEFDSPEVDNEVLIPATDQNYLRIGDFAHIRITAAEPHDLIGESLHHV